MRLLISLLISVMLLSCQQTPERCENNALMEKPNGDSLPVFELSEGMSALGHFLDSIYEIQIKSPDSLMHFYLKDSLCSPCSFDPWQLETDVIACFSMRHFFEVFINEHSQLLIEGELVKMNSLNPLWKENVLNYGLNPWLSISPVSSFLKIKFAPETPIDSLAKILSIIHQTQNEIIMEEVRSKFAVPFCDIPTDSIHTILEKYPLKIFISWREDDFPWLPKIPERETGQRLPEL